LLKDAILVNINNFKIKPIISSFLTLKKLLSSVSKLKILKSFKKNAQNFSFLLHFLKTLLPL